MPMNSNAHSTVTLYTRFMCWQEQGWLVRGGLDSHIELYASRLRTPLTR